MPPSSTTRDKKPGWNRVKVFSITYCGMYDASQYVQTQTLTVKLKDSKVPLWPTFNYTSDKDWEIKFRMHDKVRSRPQKVASR